jgi:hypothetical protein
MRVCLARGDEHRLVIHWRAHMLIMIIALTADNQCKRIGYRRTTNAPSKPKG